jgi:hypothetical protein
LLRQVLSFSKLQAPPVGVENSDAWPFEGNQAHDNAHVPIFAARAWR